MANVAIPIWKQKLEQAKSITKSMQVDITLEGKIKVSFTGEIWTRKDLDRVYGTALKELLVYYKKIKEQEK